MKGDTIVWLLGTKMEIMMVYAFRLCKYKRLEAYAYSMIVNIYDYQKAKYIILMKGYKKYEKDNSNNLFHFDVDYNRNASICIRWTSRC